MANGLFCFTYVLTVFIFDISFYIDMECTPHGPLLLTLLLHLEHRRLCPLLGYMPLISSFQDRFSYIDLGPGLQIKGELPDGAPHIILSE